MKNIGISALFRRFLCLLVWVSALLVASCGRGEYRRSGGAAWNTTFNITYCSPVALDDSIQEVLKRVEQSLSAFDSTSTISKINRNESLACDEWVVEVFNISKDVNSRTAGMFDPTASPLINLWGFGYEGRGAPVPTDSAITEALHAVGIADCRVVDGMMAKKTPATTFNFSAVAKGFGCDMMADMLRRNGCTDFMVEIGGEMVLSGNNPKGTPWRVMIDAPVDNSLPGQTAATMVSLSDCGLATSGNYRNFRTDSEGRRVGHTISPLTGRPAKSDVVSATVVAPTAAVADAYATAFMALGSAASLEIANADPSLECLLILSDSSILTSGGWNAAGKH